MQVHWQSAHSPQVSFLPHANTHEDEPEWLQDTNKRHAVVVQFQVQLTNAIRAHNLTEHIKSLVFATMKVQEVLESANIENLCYKVLESNSDLLPGRC